MEPLVRLATAEDQHALLALYGQLNQGDAQAEPERLAAVFNEILSSSHFELVVAEIDSTLVGTCYLNVVPNLTRAAASYAVVENVVVAQHMRLRGIGKAVVGFALARAWNRGCYKAMLQTGSKSETTYQFYRSCGFSQTEKVAFVARPAGWVAANPSVERTSNSGLRPLLAAAHAKR